MKDINIKSKSFNYENDLPEDERFESVNIFGNIEEINDTQKLSWSSELFEKGTLKNSCIRNELNIINNKYGYYSNGRNYMFCNIIREEIEEDDWGTSVKKIKYSYTCPKDATFSMIYDLLDDNKKEKIDKLIEERSKSYYNNNWNRNYFEFENRKNYFNLYAEKGELCYGIEISKSSAELNIGRMNIKSDETNDLEEILKNYINNEIIKFIDKGIKKLENGFIYNNKYYETFEEIREEIDEKSKAEN